MTYAWNQKRDVYDKASTANVDEEHWMDNNEVVYLTSGNITSNTVTVDLTNAEVYFGLKNNYLETVVNVAKGDLNDLISSKKAVSVVKEDGKFQVWTETNGRPNEYFTVNTLASANPSTITLQQIAIPQSNMDATLCIKVLDAYGSKSIIRLPLKYVYAETESYSTKTGTPNGPHMISQAVIGANDGSATVATKRK